ncbi:Uncharacterised protein [Salmonella enterica subsp. enterica]|uniref:Uncharacterized protein n=1 Tax=Salmonella enterica I TaxID=59201 RepID=A0A379WT28_SALET|nr:Uncharacterised protein [Salmonella enterica subsp. enterica]
MAVTQTARHVTWSFSARKATWRAGNCCLPCISLRKPARSIRIPGSLGWGARTGIKKLIPHVVREALETFMEGKN